MGNSWFITACASLNLCFNFYRNCVKYPKLVVEGVTTDDLNEVEVGNSWFITACASLNLCFNFYRNCVKYPKLVVEGVTTDDLN